MFSPFFDSEVTEENIRVSFMRCFVNMAAPLDIDGTRFTDKTDRMMVQDEYINVFL